MFLKERKKIKFFSKKHFQDKEMSQIQIFEELDESEEEKRAFNEIFPMFQESNISGQIEENSERDESRFFMDHVLEERSLLETYYPDYYLFTKLDLKVFEPNIEGFGFAVKKRSSFRLPNRRQKHYIRVNIKRTFMNRYLLNALNKKLRKAGFNTVFLKFPQSLANNVAKDFNKILLNMRLKEIFRAKDLYRDINKTNYKHNLKLVEQIEERGNPELNMILNVKFRVLFEEYVNSEEFRIAEIKRIKKSKLKNDAYYEKKYIYLAKQFIKFCCQ
jgi:hypothetical protein